MTHGSIRLGRVFGIPLEVHWSTLLLAVGAVALLADVFGRIQADASRGAILAAATVTAVFMIISVLAHEIGHGLTALNHGVPVEHIGLSAVGGSTLMHPGPGSPGVQARVAAAGPAVTFAIALGAGALAVVVDQIGAPRLVASGAAMLATVNLAMGLFNMIPVAPLDGGRIVGAALWRRQGNRWAAGLTMARVGLSAGVLGTVLALGAALRAVSTGADAQVLVTLLVVAVSCGVVALVARSEIAASVMAGRMATTTAATIAVPLGPAMGEATTLQDLDRWQPRAGVVHPVIRWGPDPVGYLATPAAPTVSGPARAWTRVGEVMRPADATEWISPTISVQDLLDQPGARQPIIRLLAGVEGEPAAAVTDTQLQSLLAPVDLWGRPRPAGPQAASRPAPPVGSGRFG
ncbi:MAG: site-2 protease family protein [Acidimicrobiales bacterium]